MTVAGPPQRGAAGDEAEERLGTLTVRNEFAAVQLRVCDSGDRARLRIEDLRTHQAVELDPVELETLAWSTHAELATLLDPSNSRWPRDAHRDGEG